MSLPHTSSTIGRNMPQLARSVSWVWSKVPTWPKLVLILGIFCALGVTLGLVMATDTRGNDDAGILWTYARNFADGSGLVYKPGEYVEGYSSFVYVLLLAVGLWTTRTLGMLVSMEVDPKVIYWVSLLINLSAWVAVIVTVYNFVKEELDEKAAASVALLVGVSPAIAYWVTSGMDSPLAMLSQVLIWVWVVRLDRRVGTERERAAFAALAAAMIFSLFARAEGFLWPMLGLVWLLWRRPRQALALGAIFAVFAAGLVSWRMWYYGYPLPNTYYAKLTGSLSERLNSAWYLQARQVIFDTGLLVAVLGILAGIVNRAALVASLPEKSQASDFELIASVAWMGYFLYVGGDVYYERPMLVLLPLGLVVAARVIYPSLKTFGSKTLAVMAAATIVAYPLWGYYRPLTTKNRGDGLEKVGKFLKENYAGSTVALNLAGKIAYYSGLPCIDMLGLCDAHIGHSEQNRPFAVGHTKRGFGYALRRKPEIVVVCPQVFTGDIWSLMIDDGYTLDDMKSIGYLPVMVCDRVDWVAVRKIDGVPLSSLSSEELKDLVARNKFDLLIFYNPKPTGTLPLRASGNDSRKPAAGP
jgi:hypothetical protein